MASHMMKDLGQVMILMSQCVTARDFMRRTMCCLSRFEL